METINDKPVVLISGFGPFGAHKVNASWTSVQHISKEPLEQKYNVKIVPIEIPVIYNEVDQLVPNLWKKYSPKLVIHTGVSANANMLTLECCAYGNDYKRYDTDGKCPLDSLCLSMKTEKITCGLEVEKIVKDYNKLNKPISACLSSNAGRYLCEYAYYTSLSIDNSRSLFVHVPDLSETFTAQNIALGLECIIDLCLEQLQKCAAQ